MEFNPCVGCGARLIFKDKTASASFTANLNDSNIQINPSTIRFLTNGITKYGLIIFPNMQKLTAIGHLRLTTIFGTPKAHPRRGRPPALPGLKDTAFLVEVATNDSSSEYYSSQIRADHWHSDVTFSPEPPSYTSLLAKAVPGEGRGDTMWASTAAAYESLSPAMQETVMKMKAVHSDRLGLNLQAIHPIVRDIPFQDKSHATKRALFINHHFTSHIEGWTEKESQPILDFLKARIIAPEYVYRHQWKLGELVIWDNRQTLHYGIFDSGAHLRTLHRTTAGYERPIPSLPSTTRSSL